MLLAGCDFSHSCSKPLITRLICAHVTATKRLFCPGLQLCWIVPKYSLALVPRASQIMLNSFARQSLSRVVFSWSSSFLTFFSNKVRNLVSWFYFNIGAFLNVLKCLFFNFERTSLIILLSHQNFPRDVTFKKSRWMSTSGSFFLNALGCAKIPRSK